MVNSVPAGRAVVTTENLDKTKASTNAMVTRYKKVTAKLNKLSKQSAMLAAKIGLPLLGAAKIFASTGDKIDKLSKRTNLSTDAAQSFGFAMEQSGKSIETLEPAIKAMNRNLLDFQRGSKEAKDNFGELGIEFFKFKSLDTAGRFRLILKHLEQIPDAGQRAALAAKILGRGGTDILPLLGNLEALEAEFDTLGSKMSKEQVEAAAKLTDEFNKLQHQFKAIAINVGSAIAPALEEFARQVGPLLKHVAEWVKANPQLAQGALKVAAGLTAVSVVMKAMALINPYTGIIVGAAAAITAIRKVQQATGTDYEGLTGVGGMFGPKSAVGHGGQASNANKQAEDSRREVARINALLSKTSQVQEARKGRIDSLKNGAGLIGSFGGSAVKSIFEKIKKAKVGQDIGKHVGKSISDALTGGADRFKQYFQAGSNIAAGGIQLAANFSEMQRMKPELMSSVTGGFGASALGFGSSGPSRPMEDMREINLEQRNLLEVIADNIEGIRNEGLE